ncbi:MAG TPA: hypothetical protein PKW35_11330 [Nannocystaceae bacterium]|nr:hypothetical protein [Nannocystaceae bacterium]
MHTPRTLALALALALGPGCTLVLEENPDFDGPLTTSATESESASSTSGASASSGDTTSMTTGMTTAGLPVCGDGVVDLGEECDDAGQNGPGYACTAACKYNVCGDGDQGPGEECDDGNSENADACTLDCTVAACGDGVVQDNEECDLGGKNGDGQACNGTCKLNVCGDGDKGPDEACDDGNVEPGDGCSDTCALEACGDGKTDPGEKCDDGNMNDDDTCTSLCAPPVCGDGLYSPSQGEKCDDGNGDGLVCSSICLVAPKGIKYIPDPYEVGPVGYPEFDGSTNFSCAENQALVGFDARLDQVAKFFKSAVPLCAPLILTTEPYQVTTGNPGPAGMGVGPYDMNDLPVTALCPKGQLLVGADVYYDFEVQKIALRCAELTVFPSNGAYQLGLGPAQLGMQVGNLDFNIYEPLDCPPGTIAKDAYLSWGSGITEIGLTCKKPQLVF